jgi:hypothetical protein
MQKLSHSKIARDRLDKILVEAFVVPLGEPTGTADGAKLAAQFNDDISVNRLVKFRVHDIDDASACLFSADGMRIIAQSK